jgi:hypothetical protein
VRALEGRSEEGFEVVSAGLSVDWQGLSTWVRISDKGSLMSVTEPGDRSPYHGYRFPPEIIAHAVWLYFRFNLSFRDVEDLLAERGVIVSHETVRQWCTKFGAAFAAGLRRRQARTGDMWHLDEVLLKINGKRHWLWRACWTSWCNHVEIKELPNASCGKWLRASATSHAS